MNKRTRWIRRLLWAAAFGCLWLNVLDDPPLHTGAYVQNVTVDAATVAKITAAPSRVQLTVLDDAGEIVGHVAGALRRRHFLRVKELKAGTRYSYVLSSPDGWSEEGTFRTAPRGDEAKVRFTFCGDSGDQPWWVWLQKTPILHYPARWRWFGTKYAVTQVGGGLAQEAPDFALHLGDVIYPKGLNGHYSSGFFRPFGELIRHAPMYPVLGNHDVMNAAGQQILANFELPTNDVTGDERNYTFANGGVRVIVLDCNTHLAGDVYREDHPTSRYLLEQLAQCSEPWIVVASHFPIRSASRQADRADLMLSMLPVLQKHHVSLYLAGHDHCYQRFGPSEKLPVPLVVSGGGGKRLYDISENPRAKTGAEALVKAFHWCVATVEGRQFSVVAKDIDGREIDAFSLTLPAGEALEALRARNPARAARIDGLE